MNKQTNHYQKEVLILRTNKNWMMKQVSMLKTINSIIAETNINAEIMQINDC